MPSVRRLRRLLAMPPPISRRSPWPIGGGERPWHSSWHHGRRLSTAAVQNPMHRLTEPAPITTSTASSPTVADQIHEASSGALPYITVIEATNAPQTAPETS